MTTKSYRDLEFGEMPRNAPGASSPGAYEIATMTHKPVLNPGDSTEIDIFITGYGMIRGSKISVYPSGHIFEEDSEITYGIEYRPEGEGHILTLGGTKSKLGAIGINFDLGGKGIKEERWEESTIYIDTYESIGVPQILTELAMPTPLIHMDLKVKNEAKAGTYSLRFTLTYFNGQEWKTSTESPQVTIRNILQRNEGKVAAVASFAAFISVLSVVLSAIAIFT